MQKPPFSCLLRPLNPSLPPFRRLQLGQPRRFDRTCRVSFRGDATVADPEHDAGGPYMRLFDTCLLPRDPYDVLRREKRRVVLQRSASANRRMRRDVNATDWTARTFPDRETQL